MPEDANLHLNLAPADSRTTRWAERNTTAALRALRENSSDQALVQVLDDVIAGRRPPRDLLGQPEFGRLAESGIAEYERRMHAMSPEEAARFSDEVTRLGNAEGIVPNGAKVPPTVTDED